FLVVLCLLHSCGTVPSAETDDAGEGTDDQVVERKQLTNLDLTSLQATKAAIQTGDNRYQAAYQALLRDADTVMQDRLYAVTDKTTMPPSGDKHDYLSLGPYWWPDLTKPDSLPWIRRDGEVNPMARGSNVDEPSKDAAFANIYTLALAAFFSDNDRYAERAREQLRVWFLDEATRMNPNLKFGQGIPGINTGRGIGIIEMIALGNVITGMELLAANDQLPKEEEIAMNQWLTTFTEWLQTSKMGIAEREWHNNHGSWYDVQVVALLQHLGRLEEARAILATAKEKRIAAHINPDGSQPHELERTKSLGYSTMNLRGLTRLAYYGQKLGVDLWNYRPEAGGDLKAAYAYLQPYAFGPKAWPYEQLGSIEKAKARTRNLFYETGAILGISAYCDLMEGGNPPSPSSRSHLLYQCPPS
ncbi:MAG: alginate lyase family protein, partial [Bacteroidota bacterium]